VRRVVNAPLTVRLERADQPDVSALIAALDDYQRPLYPAESHHGVDIPALLAPGVLFAVARTPAGLAVGTGAVLPDRQADREAGEIKRMYVLPAMRGQGIARAVLEFLELQARARGCRVLRLETGIHQPEAIRFYARQGFLNRPPFGPYREDPMSLFMEKFLAPA
jgi:putative acetyltransferase